MPSTSPGSSSASVQAAKNRHKASLTIRVHIPKKRHHVKGARFVSASTKGMTLYFKGASTFQEAVALTPSSPGCSTVATATICQITVLLTPDTYQATVATYDLAPVNGSIPLDANQLASGRSTLTVKRGTANQLGITLDGLPSTFAVTALPAGTVGTAFTSPQPFNVAAMDADGNVIVGTYSVPVALNNSDMTGATSIVTGGFDAPLPGELASSSDTAGLTYNGSPIATRITAFGLTSGTVLGGSGSGTALFVPAGVDAVTLSTDAATGTSPGLCPAGAAGDLRYAICNAQPGDTVAFVCSPLCLITLSAPLPPIEENVTIDGGSFGTAILSGNGKYRGFFVDTGTVVLKNLELENLAAQGGAGGAGGAGGGGGAGLGAGLFVNQATASVTVTNVFFEGASVLGGAGGNTSAATGGGGGGGLGADGAPLASPAPSFTPGAGGSGGGGVLAFGTSADATINGGLGGLGGGGGGGGAKAASAPFGVGGAGGAFYGSSTNGAGGTGTSGSIGTAGSGAIGGFGGGGGGGASGSAGGGAGGFGGGGGANYGGPAGSGGPGGGGGGTAGNAGPVTAATGGSLGSGIAGGSGGSGVGGGGGGGAAAGGAIFVNAGTLVTVNSSALGVSAIPGFPAAAGGAPGTADQTPVFNYGGTVNGSTTKGPVVSALGTSLPQAKHRQQRHAAATHH
jgi:hypothetical protein